MYICENDDGNALDCSSGDFVGFEKSRKKGLSGKNKGIIRAMEAYGDPNVDNGVLLRIGDPRGGKTGSINYGVERDENAPMGIRAALSITIKNGLNENDLIAAAAHEGTHAADAQAFIRSITADGPDNRLNLTRYDREVRAFSVEHAVHRFNNQTRLFDCGQINPCRFGTGPIFPNRQIQDHLNKTYSISLKSQGPVMYPMVAPNTTVPQK